MAISLNHEFINGNFLQIDCLYKIFDNEKNCWFLNLWGPGMADQNFLIKSRNCLEKSTNPSIPWNYPKNKSTTFALFCICKVYHNYLVFHIYLTCTKLGSNTCNQTHNMLRLKYILWLGRKR